MVPKALYAIPSDLQPRIDSLTAQVKRLKDQVTELTNANIEMHKRIDDLQLQLRELERSDDVPAYRD